jgi:hypothetical protein
VTTKAEPATRPIDWAASATAVVPDGRYTVEVRPGGLGTRRPASARTAHAAPTS